MALRKQVLIAGKNHKTFEDLRGGTIGATSLTSATVTALKEALSKKVWNIRATTSC